MRAQATTLLKSLGFQQSNGCLIKIQITHPQLAQSFFANGELVINNTYSTENE